ncbi:G-patch domain-containing protein [Mycena indigotica]|uniref:G-patch domain-containing protein n=1 Tax=Mycena indigotica TaxID=2126181 RepID=A0A8H6W0W7_9AGAR|nr:G-patch domain-containing protein [Mycena indigotica]KAF7301424.1 G-patch domain-containing protein [Mycena indigotica]
MSDDEDDYLANLDKFLVEPSTSSGPKSYSQLRKEAEKKSRAKNEQNRVKGRRQREAESREEGLNKSLFTRAKEDEDAGLSSGNKALSIMMKMGFKPGQTLGNPDDNQTDAQPERPASPVDQPDTETRHNKADPLPINEWAGKRGIGLGVKRARSPSFAERVAKMAKMADDTRNRDFRDRARQEYEERRAEGRLVPAQRTCVSLDEKAGKVFNALWVNPREPDTFPPGLFEALSLYTTTFEVSSETKQGSDSNKTDRIDAARLRRQMAADALQPLGELTDDGNSAPTLAIEQEFPSEVLEETSHFLRLQASDRLEMVLSYLRDNYYYCFWCGTRYENAEDLGNQCPGESEDAHD